MYEAMYPSTVLTVAPVESVETAVLGIVSANAMPVCAVIFVATCASVVYPVPVNSTSDLMIAS